MKDETAEEWKNFAIGLIDGLERQLRSSAPKTARLQLAELRGCAIKASNAKARNSLKRKIDKLVESTPYFRGASRRVIGEYADLSMDATERCFEGLIRFARVRGDKKAERKLTKSLSNLRKKRRKPFYKPVAH